MIIDAGVSSLIRSLLPSSSGGSSLIRIMSKATQQLVIIMRIRNWLSTFHDGDGSRPETEEKHLLFSFAIYRKCWAFFFYFLSSSFHLTSRFTPTLSSFIRFNGWAICTTGRKSLPFDRGRPRNVEPPSSTYVYPFYFYVRHQI